MSDTQEVKKTRGPRKPVTGKFELEFLQETAAPERKPLSRGPQTSIYSDFLKELSKHPGKLAVMFSSPDAHEVNVRRASLISTAERLGIKLDEKNTCSRAFVKNGSPVTDESGKQLQALYVMVAAS